MEGIKQKLLNGQQAAMNKRNIAYYNIIGENSIDWDESWNISNDWCNKPKKK